MEKKERRGRVRRGQESKRMGRGSRTGVLAVRPRRGRSRSCTPLVTVLPSLSGFGFRVSGFGRRASVTRVHNPDS
jgi:hypothetical protein